MKKVFLTLVAIFVLGVGNNSKAQDPMNKKNANWEQIVKENEDLGYKKRMIPFEFLSDKGRKQLFPGQWRSNNWSNGLWLNYKDEMIKFGEGEKRNYIEIPFQDLYDIRIDCINISKTKGWIIGGSVSFATISTTSKLKNITIQIVIKDPNGGVKSVDLILCDLAFAKVKEGEMVKGYEKCAAAILDEISYIIDNRP